MLAAVFTVRERDTADDALWVAGSGGGARGLRPALHRPSHLGLTARSLMHSNEGCRYRTGPLAGVGQSRLALIAMTKNRGGQGRHYTLGRTESGWPPYLPGRPEKIDRACRAPRASGPEAAAAVIAPASDAERLPRHGTNAVAARKLSPGSSGGLCFASTYRGTSVGRAAAVHWKCRV